MTEKVTDVFERSAPGFRDIVIAARAVPAERLAVHNANLVGGDIGVGANNMLGARSPGRLRGSTRGGTPIPHAYLCSSATPPGGGVHGMAGYYAARTMLKREFSIKKLPEPGGATAIGCRHDQATGELSSDLRLGDVARRRARSATQTRCPPAVPTKRLRSDVVLAHEPREDFDRAGVQSQTCRRQLRPLAQTSPRF